MDVDSNPSSSGLKRASSPTGSVSAKRRKHDDDQTLFNRLNDKLDIFSKIMEVQHELGRRDRTIDYREAMKTIQDLDVEAFTSLKEVVTKGAASGKWEDLINHPVLQELVRPLPPPRQSVPPANRRDTTLTASRAATVASWSGQFVGTANEAFIETLDAYINQNDISYYARFISIVQSSGMGKSRMIDEVARTKFVVPINLRKGDGYPPPDEPLKTYFNVDAQNHDLYAKRCTGFLISLFENCARVISTKKMKPAEFRDWLALGGSYLRPGPHRALFYSTVVDEASKISDTLEPCTASTPPHTSTMPEEEPSPPNRNFRYHKSPVPSENNAVQEANFFPALSGSQKLFPDANIIPKVDVPQPMAGPEQESDEKGMSLIRAAERLLALIEKEEASRLQLLVAFDEADALTEAIPDVEWTRLSILQSILGRLRKLPIFFCALATTGKIQQFTPPPTMASSARVQRRLLKFYPPFTSLGFDQLSRSTTIRPKDFTLKTVTSTAFIVSLGRPLFASRYFAGIMNDGRTEIRDMIVQFAGDKLLCIPNSMHQKTFTPNEQFAMIATRVPLEFNAVTTDQRNRENEFVEKHMRVCLDVSPGFESVTTVAASEPLLSEAAEEMMQKLEATEVPRCLLREWESGGLSKGNRGEIVAALLCLLARDRARRSPSDGSRHVSVPRFFSALVNLNHASNIMESYPYQSRSPPDHRTFLETFGESYMWFNHFIQVEDFLVINWEYLWGFMARGCAVICADNQYGVDIIIPIAFGDKRLEPANTSAILLQVRNRKNYSAPKFSHFDYMDPWDVGLLNKGDTPLPLIRILFSMSSDDPMIKVREAPKRINPPREAKAAGQDSKFTTFDIWFGGISTETLSGVSKDSEAAWKDTLQVARDRRLEVFMAKGKSAKSAVLTKAQHPLTVLEDAHWACYPSVAKKLRGKA